MKIKCLVLLQIIFTLLSTTIFADNSTITGAGATFPYPLYTEWAESYRTETGITLNYHSIGSGEGIKQIEAGTVDFGASDKPLSEKELDQNDLVQFPIVIGGIAVVFNIPGLKTGELKLSGPVLADIYAGNIKKWNDERINNLNPFMKLPNLPITTVHRDDDSGTTFLFTSYLAKTNDEWKNKVGSDTKVAWPVGIGAKENQGMATVVSRTAGSIGYVEYTYAQQNGLPYIQLINKAGHAVYPSRETFISAVENSSWAADAQFFQVLIDPPGDNSWPITGTTYVLMQRIQNHPDKGAIVLDFFNWAYYNKQGITERMNYVPLSNTLIEQIKNYWIQQIKDKEGHSIWG